MSAFHEELRIGALPTTGGTFTPSNGTHGQCACGWGVDSTGPGHETNVFRIWNRHRRGLPLWDKR